MAKTNVEPGVETQPVKERRRRYAAPAITHEVDIETRAGTPLPPLAADPTTGELQNPWDPSYQNHP